MTTKLFSPLEQFDVIQLTSFTLFGYDFSFLNVIFPLILLFIFIIFFYFNYLEFKLIPSNWQYIFELFYKFIFNIFNQQITKNDYVYFPLIFTLFNFILFCNLLSMTPFAIALTSHVILTLFLSLSLCLSIFILGFKFHGLAFLKIFIPECPFLLLFLLIPIEIFSYVIRSFSLAIRLSANIMAGHTLVYIVSSFIFNIIQIKFWFIIFSSFLFAILILELGIAFLQTYIFTILLCIYLSDAYNGGH